VGHSKSDLMVRHGSMPLTSLAAALILALIMVFGCHREPNLGQLSPDLAAMLKASGHREVLAKTKYEVEKNPSAVTYERLAQAYALTHETEEVVRALQAALDLDPDYPRAVLGMAVVRLRQGRFSDAQSMAEKLLDAKQRGPAEAQTVVVRALLGLDKAQEAAEFAGTALNQHPRYAPLHYAIGDALMSLRQIADATEAYRKAVQLDDEEPKYRQAMILALLMDQKTDEAVQEARIAQKKVPDSTSIQFLVGTIYSAAGDTQAAVAAYEEALLLDPDMGPAANNLAQTLADLGEQLNRAEELASKALRQDPHNHAYADTLGWVWVRLGQYSKAVELLQKVRDQWPESPSVKYHLGYALAKSGELQQGKKLLSEAAEAKDRLDVSQVAQEALEEFNQP
jgi:tetratricopeptide (TPR) repeat protein